MCSYYELIETESNQQVLANLVIVHWVDVGQNQRNLSILPPTSEKPFPVSR